MRVDILNRICYTNGGNMDIPYDDALLHTRWVNGLQYLRECNPEEDIRLIQTNVLLLSVIAAITLDNYQDVVPAMIASMGTVLRLGYYLGQNGIGASAPIMSPEFAKEQLIPLINPNCDCDSCQAKIDLLKESGIGYEAPPERQGKSIIDTVPPDNFDVGMN